VPAALSVFRAGPDGKLEFVRKYDVDTTGGKTHYWMGIVGLP
jgi:6-phosphogluconolactonase